MFDLHGPLLSTAMWIVAATVTVTQLSLIATSVYLHRALAHRSLVLPPVVDVIFRAVLWLTTGQQRQEWVAVHRKHHAFTDREGDPHSPRMVGFWRIQFLNVVYYVREARNPDTLQRFARDLAPDWLDRVVFSRGLAGPAVGTVALCVVLGLVPGLIAAALHGVLYVFVAAPLINGLGHWRGAQNFRNTAYNSRVLAWLTAGESLHNNHHAHPAAPKFSMRRSEFDPSWVVIRVMEALRLAVVVGTPVRYENSGS